VSNSKDVPSSIVFYYNFFGAIVGLVCSNRVNGETSLSLYKTSKVGVGKRSTRPVVQTTIQYENWKEGLTLTGL